MNSVPKRALLFYAIAFLLFILFLFFNLSDAHTVSGWMLVLFFLSIAVGFRSNKFLKGLSFTMIILAMVTAALYHPEYFISYGNFKFSKLIIPLLQVIMFGMGTELSLKDFAQVARMPRGIFIGIAGHYLIMPLLGFGIARIFNFPPGIAAGILLVGCCPSGLASNVMSYLANANLALSVSVTTISTILAPLLTPLLMRLLGGGFITIDFWTMTWDITKLVILPIIAGLLFNHLLRGKARWLDKLMPLISMMGIAVIIVVITAAGRDNLLQVGLLLIVATLLHNVAGYFFGYWAGRIFKFPERDCRTIALEVGMQNAGLASGLALMMGKLTTAGLAPAIFGPVMNITGSALANWWHINPPKDPAHNNNEIIQGIHSPEMGG